MSLRVFGVVCLRKEKRNLTPTKHQYNFIICQKEIACVSVRLWCVSVFRAFPLGIIYVGSLWMFQQFHKDELFQRSTVMEELLQSKFLIAFRQRLRLKSNQQHHDSAHTAEYAMSQDA